MKRLNFVLCLLVSTQMIFAQIITSKSITVERTAVLTPKKEYPYAHKKGYRGFVEGAFAPNFSDNFTIGFDVLTTHGYQCGSLFYVGLGTGLLGTGTSVEITKHTHYLNQYDQIKSTSEDETELACLLSVPLYGNARLYLTKTKVKPFLDIKLGGLISLSSKKLHDDVIECQIPKTEEWNWHHDTNDNSPEYTKISYGGLYSQVGFGLESKRMVFSFNYSIRSRHFESYIENELDYEWKNHNLGIFTLNVGVHF